MGTTPRYSRCGARNCLRAIPIDDSKAQSESGRRRRKRRGKRRRRWWWRRRRDVIPH